MNHVKHVNVEQMCQMLNSRDWKDRMEALKKLQKDASCVKHLTETQALEVMDQMTARLNDGNSKVLLIALEVNSLHSYFINLIFYYRV